MSKISLYTYVDVDSVGVIKRWEFGTFETTTDGVEEAKKILEKSAAEAVLVFEGWRLRATVKKGVVIRHHAPSYEDKKEEQ